MKMKRLSLLPFLAFASMLLIPTSGALASILLSAGNFTLLGGTTITSSGTVGTVISNGNVGLYPGTAITGFPPAVIENGAIIATGSITAQARLDLIKAQAGLNAMVPDANLSNEDLGGKTLVSGVYKFNEGANQTGALVLDGQGKDNMFWVFQIGTALTTAINATITIINPGPNGGRDYGIFWNCGTAINVGANNQIAGIYLAGTSIVFGGNSTKGGRALALAGVTLDNNQIDALGGPGGGDWSGGLTYDNTGKIVPLPASATSSSFSFRYFGKHKRTTHAATRLIKGSATAGVAKIQWRINGQKWRAVGVRADSRWVVKVRHIHPGKNKLRLRAVNAGGEISAVQRVVISRR